MILPKTGNIVPSAASIPPATPITAPATPPVAVATPAGTTSIKKSKLKSNLLDLVKEEVNITSQQEIKIIELNPKVVEQLFQDFIVYLEQELQKNTAAQQLKLARAVMISEKEVAVLCSSEINKVMVTTQKDNFSDYLKTQTKQPDIRIQIGMDEDVVTIEAPVEKKRSKFDIFETMALKNPVLIDLRKNLNLIFE